MQIKRAWRNGDWASVILHARGWTRIPGFSGPPVPRPEDSGRIRFRFLLYSYYCDIERYCRDRFARRRKVRKETQSLICRISTLRAQSPSRLHSDTIRYDMTDSLQDVQSQTQTKPKRKKVPISSLLFLSCLIGCNVSGPVDNRCADYSLISCIWVLHLVSTDTPGMQPLPKGEHSRPIGRRWIFFRGLYKDWNMRVIVRPKFVKRWTKWIWF